ncbi:ras-related protein Rab-36 [Topomyia yanbarensis]|uniref:ras-related protein Rab-36 n=1 Tax=Topomyia yanbarensis TaxID=2498891 RepID=UPI00273C5E61|nr:ras-related protein Rab-36 [Topomyia yanbarensis]
MPIYKKTCNKSSNYKILDNHVDYGTRQIDHIPLAYCDRASPYGASVEFGERTRRACENVASFYLCACKAIFIGDVSAGKSSLVNRFCHEIFDSDYRSTIGLELESEKFHVLNQSFSLQIWDTSGHERLKCITESYYQNANVVVVVFDMTNEQSLRNARRWLDEVLEMNQPGVLKFLVGSKMDLLDKPSLVQIESEASDLANELKAEYWSVSAQTGQNVTKFFQRVTALAFDAAVQRLMDPNYPIGYPSGNSLLNLYYLKEDRKHKKSRKYSFCKIN